MIDRRSLIRNSSAAGFGALALAAVSSGSELAYGATEGQTGHSDGFPAHLTAAERKHLKIFDELDFEIFTGQKWDRLHESHARNIRVHWPDGHFTDGIDKHIADLAALFVWAPDTRIQEHPFRLANGQLTAVTGYMKGTFTKPMPDGKGGFIQPTGKSYNLPMATVGIWNKRNTMDEEYLFWDNQTFFAQIGLG
ncbi:hypothetical protein GCM10009554_49530 [Kribbella koreensis]|uniref:Polyketide cyclase n=2 Tax=Kribbella TaxID=182639 RepID=A0ABP6Z222_9ACTN